MQLPSIREAGYLLVLEALNRAKGQPGHCRGDARHHPAGPELAAQAGGSGGVMISAEKAETV